MQQIIGAHDEWRTRFDTIGAKDMVQLGEKVSFIATYKSDLFQKDDWRICAFEAKYDPEYFPGTLDEKRLAKRGESLSKGNLPLPTSAKSWNLQESGLTTKKGRNISFLSSWLSQTCPLISKKQSALYGTR